MSNQLLASKVVIQEGQPSLIQFPTLNTAVAGFIGIAQKGPVATPVLCNSFTDFYNAFGSYYGGYYLALAVAAFFANGGTTCYVVRTVHYSPDTSSQANKQSAQATTTLQTAAIAATSGANTCANAAPYNLLPGQTIVTVIDAYGAATTTFNATAAALTAANSGTYALSNGMTLTLVIDPAFGGLTQTVTFTTGQFVNIAAATATEVAAAISAAITGASSDVNGGKPRITSARKGTGSSVQVTGGTANAALGFNTTAVTGTGNVSSIAAVTAAEVASAIGTSLGGHANVTASSGYVTITSVTTGVTSIVQVTGSSTATAIGFDNAVHTGLAAGTLNTLQVQGFGDGSFANSLQVVIAAPTSGIAGQFNLQVVTTAGVVLESYSNLTIGAANATASNYAPTVINGLSTWVVVTDLAAPTTAVMAIPATGTSPALTGGLDGLSGLSTNDFIGSQSGPTGLYAFDSVDTLTLLAAPESLCAGSAVHNAMLTYCSVQRSNQVFAILDPPASQSASAICTYVLTTASLLNITEMAQIYWPRWTVNNPSSAAFGATSTIVAPLSGHIAGMYARVDGARVGGVYDVPAGPDYGKLLGLLAPEPTGVGVQREAVRDLVFPNRINPVWSGTGIPVNLDGARTLKSNGNWPTVAQRRGMSNIETACRLAMQVFRQKRRDSDLIAAEYRAMYNYLKTQTALGAFASKDPKKAFWIDLGPALNPPSTPNITQANIGVATAQPNEFIVLNFFQDSTLGT